MSDQLRAAAASYLRTLLGAVLAAIGAVLAAGVDLTTGEGWKALGAAAAGAAVVTITNALRSGETRYGVGSDPGELGDAHGDPIEAA